MEETRSDFKKSLAAMGFKRGKRPKGHVERKREREREREREKDGRRNVRN